MLTWRSEQGGIGVHSRKVEVKAKCHRFRHLGTVSSGVSPGLASVQLKLMSLTAPSAFIERNVFSLCFRQGFSDREISFPKKIV